MREKFAFFNERLSWVDCTISKGQSFDQVAQWFLLCEQSWPMFFQAEGSFESDLSKNVLNQHLLAYRVLGQNPEMKQIPFALLRSVGRAFCSHREGKPVAGCNDAAANFASLSVSRDSAGFLATNMAWVCEHTLLLNVLALGEEKLKQFKDVQRFGLGELFLLSKKEGNFNFVVGYKESALKFRLNREKKESAGQPTKVEIDDIPF